MGMKRMGRGGAGQGAKRSAVCRTSYVLVRLKRTIVVLSGSSLNSCFSTYYNASIQLVLGGDVMHACRMDGRTTGLCTSVKLARLNPSIPC